MCRLPAWGQCPLEFRAQSMLIDGHYGSSGEFDLATHARDTGDGDPAGDGPYWKPGSGPWAHQGTVYLTNGVASLPKTGPLDHPAMEKSIGDVPGSVVIDIAGNQLDARFIGTAGQVLDHFRIQKGGLHPLPAGSPATRGFLAAALVAAGVLGAGRIRR